LTIPIIIELIYRNTKQMTAEILTKPLSLMTHAKHAEHLGITLQGSRGSIGDIEPRRARKAEQKEMEEEDTAIVGMRV
jgi:hypothetical protein